MTRKVLILIIIFLLFTSCTHWFKKEQPDAGAPVESAELVAENYVSDAIDYYQAAKYRQAISGWKKALEMIPEDAEVHNFVGLAYHRIGKLDSAIIYFEKAVEIDPDYYQAWNNMGYMYFLQANYQKALEFFDQALKANPNYEQARLNRVKTSQIIDGKIKIQAFELVERSSEIDSLELQIANYRKALQIDSNYADAWNNLGVAYYYSGNLDSAVIALKKALDKSPDYAPAHNNVGFILDSMGEYERAIAHYQKAIELRPNYLIAMANLLDSYVHKRDLDSAKIVFQALRQMDPGNSLVQQRIEEYQELLFGNKPQGGE